MSTAHSYQPWRELAVRESDGLAVSLLWCKAANRVKVAVTDVLVDERFEFCVRGADALAAFHHPYAYAFAAERGATSGDIAPRAHERSVVQ